MNHAGARRRLVGELTVATDCATAYNLFTPLGERTWAVDWEPSFPADGSTEAAPGLVWETSAHGDATYWVVVDADPGRRVRYARVSAGLTAGTITVELEPAAGGSTVRVVYDLTALTGHGREWLDGFASGYEAYIADWATAIARVVA